MKKMEKRTQEAVGVLEKIGWEMMVEDDGGVRMAEEGEVGVVAQLAGAGRDLGASWQEIEVALEKIGIKLREVKKEEGSVI